MANEKFTQLPTVANAQLTDIICAVQAGISSQETLQQIVNLGLSQTILNFAGNPNGSVAGSTYQLCFDTTNSVLYVCTTSGSTSTAVWTSIVPKTNRILDSNNLTVFGLTGTASAVNYLNAMNNITGNGPTLSAQGTDPNISLNIAPKGTGAIGLVTAALTQPVFIYSGTTNQHVTRFQMANTAADRTVTFQDAAGTLAYLSDIPAGSPSALTRVDDTNVTLTLGGTPATALLQATSITAGWSGTLSGARGGTGVANTGLTITLAGGASGYLLTSDSSGNATWAAPGYLTGSVLLNPSGDQTILAHNLTVAAGTFTSGATGGGVNGALILYPNSASAGGFRIFNDTVSSFTTTLKNSSVGQGTTLSLPDPGAATANVLLDASASNKSINYRLTMPSIAFSSTSGIIGTTTNDSAAAGSVGEFVSATTSFAAPVSLTTDTAADIASISLTAGDWDVWGNVAFLGNAATLVQYQTGWVSSTSATNPGRDSVTQQVFSAAGVAIFAAADSSFNVQQRRISIASTTTIYLSAQSGFSVNSTSGYGNIFARRVR